MAAFSPRFYAGDDAEKNFNTFVAIDFGTTFSGFAFAVGRNSRVFHDEQKVPTCLLLDKDTRLKSFGQDALVEYSDVALDGPTDMYYFDRFKMKLHNEEDVNRHMLIEALEGKTLDAETVFARSMEYFYLKAKEEIAKHGEAALREDEIKWVLTVPAIWGQRAKELMLSAAQKAGMPPDNVDIALEPEAAAFASRQDLLHVYEEQGRPEHLRVVMVDCGGGTVDVKVQDIDMATGKYRDIDMADGGAWGGTVVDKKIREVVAESIGPDMSAAISDLNWILFERQVIEDAKKTVGSSYRDKIVLRFTPQMCTAIEQAGGNLNDLVPRVDGVQFRKRAHCLLVSRPVIERCFEESLVRISDHIEAITRRIQGIHCILMVGGFSDSPILLRRIEARFNSLTCRVVHPSDSSLAVLRGAVLHGQQPDMVESRVSRFTYGVRSHTDFIDGLHPEERLVVNDGRRHCRDIFVIYVRKGESVPADRPLQEKPFSPVLKNQLRMEASLYYSPDPNVEYADEPGSRVLGSIIVESPNIELGLDRVLVVSIDFSGTMLKFAAKDISSGREKAIRVRFECI